jgi:hypothetical protein
MVELPGAQPEPWLCACRGVICSATHSSVDVYANMRNGAAQRVEWCTAQNWVDVDGNEIGDKCAWVYGKYYHDKATNQARTFLSHWQLVS